MTPRAIHTEPLRALFGYARAECEEAGLYMLVALYIDPADKAEPPTLLTRHSFSFN